LLPTWTIRFVGLKLQISHPLSYTQYVAFRRDLSLEFAIFVGLYINDIVKIFHFNTVSYANDANLHISNASGTNYGNLCKRVNDELKKILVHLNYHQLTKV